MSEENVEVVRRIYEILDQFEVDSVLRHDPDARALYEQLCHPDFELISPPEWADASGTFHGYEGLRTFARALDEAFDDIKFSSGRHIAAGDSVVFAVTAHATGKRSGGRPEMEVAHLWELEAARATRCVIHGSFEEALEAAGLSE